MIRNSYIIAEDLNHLIHVFTGYSVSLNSIDKIIDYSSEISALCENTILSPYDIFHHFPLKDDSVSYLKPDNWKMPKYVRRIVLHMIKQLQRYASKTIKECKKRGYKPNKMLKISHKKVFSGDILPPWFLFPHLTEEDSLFYKGIGRKYTVLYNDYIASLSDQERWKYEGEYPKPVYFVRSKNHLNAPDNITDLISASNNVLSLCEDVSWPGEAYIRHHFPLKNEAVNWLRPDNWNIDIKQMSVINKNLAVLTNYANTIIDKYSKKGFSPFNPSKGAMVNPKSLFEEEILPPWIIFPHYHASTMGWRMGLGEDYMFIYSRYFNSLSELEKTAYKAKYPIPEYMKPRDV